MKEKVAQKDLKNVVRQIDEILKNYDDAVFHKVLSLLPRFRRLRVRQEEQNIRDRIHLFVGKF